MDGSVLEEKSFFKVFGLTFSSKLDWVFDIIYITKTASKKIGSLVFLSPEVALYLYKSTIQQCMKYCCQVWGDAHSCYLELLDKLQKQIHRSVGHSLAISLESLAHRRIVASSSLFYRYCCGRCLFELAGSTFLVLYFSYYTLMTSLIISVILLYMLMILLSSLSVIKHPICGNN